MNIRFFSSLILMLLCAGISIGQELPKVIPQSPNAAAFTKYGEIPVSHYTGVPSISIPLYTAVSGDIEVPLVLNYHASGVKVMEEASWVGLGWSLSQGGVISRNIVGLDDLEASGFHATTPLPEATQANIDRYTNILQETTDPAPDSFNYNILGYSGKFILPKNYDGGISLKQNGLLFKYLWIDNKWRWVVTDTKGWEFYLDVEETTESMSTTTVDGSNSNSFELPKITSWYLSKVINPKGDQVTFNYTSSYGSQLRPQETITQTFGPQITMYYNNGNTEVLNNEGFFPQSKTVSISTIRNKYLERIDFTNGYVLFNFSDRNDIEKHPSIDLLKPQRLNSIEVFDLNDLLIKKIELTTSYFGGVSFDNSRLRLDQVQESTLSETKPPYVFNYDLTTNLPNKSSVDETDHWGYTTKKQNVYKKGGTLLSLPAVIDTPEFTISNLPVPNLQFMYPDGDLIYNRHVDPTRNQAGTLKSLKYPTGGITHFTYETNDFYNLDYVQAVDFSDITTPVFREASDHPSNVNPITSFTLNATTNVALSCEMADEYYNRTGDSPLKNNVVVRLLNANGVTLLEYDPGNVSEFSSGHLVSLPAGTYSLEARKLSDYNDPNSNGPNNYYVSLQATYNLTTSFGYNGHYLGGGLRIQKIENFTSTNELVNTQIFNYEDSSGNSTGKLLAPIRYKNYMFNTPFFNEGALFVRDWVVYSSNSNVPIGSSSQGNSVGYNMVSVSELNNNNQIINGRKDYYFKNSLESFDFSPSGSIPLNIPLNNGLLEKEVHYNNSNDPIYKKIKEYSKNTTGSIVSKAVKLNYLGNINNWLVNIHTLNISEYHVHSEWWHLDQEEEIIYDINGQDPVSKVTNYFYDNINHLQVTKKEIIDSEGSALKTEVDYPQDIDSQSRTTAEESLIASHQVAIPIKTRTFIKKVNEPEERISSEYTIYNDSKWPGLNLPESIETSKGVESLQARIKFHDYDDKGNPIEVSKESGTHIYYIWGYNKEYPIAKIENFTSTQASDIQSLITAAENTSDLDNDRTINYLGKEGDLREALDNIRNHISLNTTMVSTYTYDPLIGVTSITDPKGYTTYYEYDEFNRLKFVKDADGNLLSENKYNYKN